MLVAQPPEPVRNAPQAMLRYLRTSVAGFFLVFATALMLSSSARAQQFTRDTADIPPSSDYTENVDFADVDNDGDWDAAFAEGGDNGNAQNHLWINQGGAQGGTIGVFTNVTATQFPVVSDDSRDVEFVDFDNDGDVDLYISNTSTHTNQGNRWWTNMGGIQGGTVGFYTDETSTRWAGLGGAGSSIPPSQVLAGGGFIDFSCDCDFGDLNNDGNIDLLHSTYGGAFGGQIPMRIFLNDGTGVFSEFNPSGFQLSGQHINNGDPGLWCEGTQSADTIDSTGVHCDIASTTLDIEIGDIDGDLDLDILQGARVELPRMFQNRFQENGGTLGFRDVTGSAYPSGYSTGDGHYASEFGDFDNDGDLDIYGLNWLQHGFSFTDCTMKNVGNGTFNTLTALSNSDSDDNEGDFIDYDEDGNVDLFIANFSGQDRFYHNDGTGVLTYQATGTILPSDTTQSLDADGADVDNDGDPDIFVANDANQAEWFLKNNGTNHDTSAPRLYRLEQAHDRAPSAAPTVVRVQVYDNQPYYGTWYIPVHLEVSVDGGAPTNYPMRPSMGQIFRGEIPGTLSGTITYHAVASDQYGNTGVSGSHFYISQGSSPMVSFCEPGVGGTIACPCGNPPAVAGRGCDNFGAASGGAVLSAVGVPSLAADTLVLTCTGENSTAFTIFAQGTTSNPTGTIFGAGVRCAGGALKRLYNGPASAGAITRPGAGDPSISVRSAALGNTIHSGETRFYFAYYRDPQAAAPCANPGSTFNSSQSGSIVWAP
jgi:hypothetical protein